MDWQTLISSMGFPICACVALGYFCKYLIDKNREDIAAMNEKHEREIEEMTEALNNNTLIIAKLVERMSTHEEDFIN